MPFFTQGLGTTLFLSKFAPMVAFGVWCHLDQCFPNWYSLAQESRKLRNKFGNLKIFLSFANFCNIFTYIEPRELYKIDYASIYLIKL